MHGVVSLLPPKQYKLIEELWQKLADECGLKGVQVTPYPHFSWQIGVDYPEPDTSQAIQAIAQETRPFTVRTNGLGIFSGPSPVVYIPIVRSPKLNQLHKKLWQCLAPNAERPSSLYSPQTWVPHITMIFGENDNAAVLHGLELLAFRPFTWEIEVDHIAFLSQPPGQTASLMYRHDFLTT